MKQEELTHLIKEVLDEVVGKAFARAGRMSDLGREYTLTPAEKRRRAAIPATDVNIPAMDPDAPEEPTVVAEPTSPTVVAEPTRVPAASPTAPSKEKLDALADRWWNVLTDDERASELRQHGRDSGAAKRAFITSWTSESLADKQSVVMRIRQRERSGIDDADKTRIMSADEVERVQRAIHLKQQIKQQLTKESIQKTIKVKILKSK